MNFLDTFNALNQLNESCSNLEEIKKTAEKRFGKDFITVEDLNNGWVRVYFYKDKSQAYEDFKCDSAIRELNKEVEADKKAYREKFGEITKTTSSGIEVESMDRDLDFRHPEDSSVFLVATKSVDGQDKEVCINVDQNFEISDFEFDYSKEPDRAYDVVDFRITFNKPEIKYYENDNLDKEYSPEDVKAIFNIDDFAAKELEETIIGVEQEVIEKAAWKYYKENQDELFGEDDFPKPYNWVDENLNENIRTYTKSVIVEEHFHYVLAYDNGDHLVYYSGRTDSYDPFEDDLNNRVKKYETEEEAKRDVYKANKSWCDVTECDYDQLVNEWGGFEPLEIIDGEKSILTPEQLQEI